MLILNQKHHTALELPMYGVYLEFRSLLAAKGMECSEMNESVSGRDLSVRKLNCFG